MKKIILLTILLLVSGCGLLDISNTPTKKVEEYLNKYQILDESILNDLDNVIRRKDKLDNNENEYREIIKRQYKELEYKIKDERIDGDEAIVTAEITVYDLTKVINDSEKYKTENITEFYENDKYNEDLYKKYLITKLKNTKEKITYTVDFKIHKENKKWMLNSISEIIEDKILGIYNYNN